jgi:NitT/TauT family transport system substrate-binding protein
MFVESIQAEPVKLKVLLLPYMSFAPFFIAREEGYFTEQGLDIEFVKMEKGADAIPALIKGKLDVAGGTANISVFNAIMRSNALEIVADKGHIASEEGCPAYALVARRSLIEAGELTEPAQLQGRQISVKTVTQGGYFTEKLLQTVDLTFDDVIVNLLPNPVLSQALETGAIDVVHTGEPWITRLLQGGDAVLWVPAKAIVPDSQFAVVLYGPTLVQNNPELGKRFMVAYLRAIRQYNQGKAVRNLDILAQYTGLDQDLLRTACWPTLHDDGSINFDSLVDFQKWAIEKGKLDNIVPKEQFWDARFIEYANQNLNRSSK